MAKRIFITAAEVSGDLHASHLIRALLQLDPTLQIEGHGGPKMRAAGATIHQETTVKAAMGLSALGRIREMLALVKWTREYFGKSRPDLQICVDSPAVNFHFAKAAHALKIPVLSYVAPQLWAWREGRMKKLRRWIDRLACILPFEEPYFRSHGVNATFVGHPLFDEFHPPPPESAVLPDPATFPTIGLLAGSRASEAKANFPRMVQVANQLLAAFPTTRFLLPTTAATQPFVTALLASHPQAERFRIEQDAFDQLVPQCDLAITVSGTATLHVAMHEVPMIVVYYGNPLAWNLLGRWLIKTRTYVLVNLLGADPTLASSGRVTREMHLVPEFIPWYGDTAGVAAYATDLLQHPEKLAAQKAKLAQLVLKLHHSGASMNVAKMAMEMLAARDQASVVGSVV
jgi:lipid-A-disaccharide synthase